MPSEPDEAEPDVVDLSETADRLDDLAETAELMGDADGAQRWRERALAVRMSAMRRLDT